MLTNARAYLLLDPWLAIAPGAAIGVTVLALNLLGDALRDALDPRLATSARQRLAAMRKGRHELCQAALDWLWPVLVLLAHAPRGRPT